MITLDEFIKDKQINEYLINKPVSGTTGKKLIFPILKKDQSDYSYKWVSDKKITIPKGKFFIYNDKYHKRRHIATLIDMGGGIGSQYDDYEDFSEKDIIKGFNTLKEAVEFAMNDQAYHRYYDSKYFMQDVLNGNITDKDLLDIDNEFEGNSFDEAIIYGMLMYTDIENLPKKYK